MYSKNQTSLQSNNSIEKNYDFPCISVIIPIFNVEKYLSECLDSVINQTYRFLEIILLDDGSTDSSGKICDEYKKNDIRIKVIHQDNHGAGHARNIGLSKASGKYIIFLDSDDYWELDALEKLVNVAENDNLDVVVFSAKAFYDGVKKKKVKGHSYSHKVQNNIVKSGSDSLSCAKANGEYFTAVCLRLYRRDYIINNHFTFNEGIIHEDEVFSFLSYINANRVVCLGERFYHRRYRAGSIMVESNLFKSAHGCKIALETLFQYIQDHSFEFDSQTAKLYTNQLRSYIFAIYSRYKEAKKINESKRIKDDTHKTIKLVCTKSKEFPILYRVVFYNYRIGYSYWLIRKKYYRFKRKIKRCFSK